MNMSNPSHHLAEVLRGTLDILDDDLFLGQQDMEGSIDSIVFELDEAPDESFCEDTAQAQDVNENSIKSTKSAMDSSLFSLMASSLSIKADMRSFYKASENQPLHVPCCIPTHMHEGFASSLHNPFEPTPLLDAASSLPDVNEPTLVMRDTGMMLHTLCYGYESSSDGDACKMLQLVHTILEKDPEALLRPHDVHATRNVWNPQACHKTNKRTKSSYHFPIHIALANRATPVPVIVALLNAATALSSGVRAVDALMIVDGPQRESPLMVLLKNHPSQSDLLDGFLLAAPASVALLDRRSNTALHIAVQYGANMVAVRHLVILEPKSCLALNMLAQTPLQLAQKRGLQDCGVVNFLSARSYRFMYKSGRS
jgi:hypothetical protein